MIRISENRLSDAYVCSADDQREFKAVREFIRAMNPDVGLKFKTKPRGPRYGATFTCVDDATHFDLYVYEK